MSTENQSIDRIYGYVFDLHLLCGGYAYYSTYSRWEKSGEHGREFRSPRETNSDYFGSRLASLGQQFIIVQDESGYDYWLRHKGWAIVPTDLTRSTMPQWLKSRQCVVGPYETFTDVEICSKNSLSHYASPGKREKVFERDGWKCLVCKKNTDDGIQLTMQHVYPFGMGGETTTRNLVTLCEECNAGMGTKIDYSLYKAAGISYGFELGILRGGNFTRENFDILRRLSSNMMHTRCDVW